MKRVYHGIEFDSESLAAFCQRHAFGPEGSPSLLDLGGMLVELTEMFGRQVDLKTWGFMSDRIRRQVERERQVQYAA